MMFVGGFGTCARSRTRLLPSGAPGTNSGAVLGPAQFQVVRTLEACLHCTHGGLRIEAGCSADEQWADCGVHVGHCVM
eukprot:3743783-Alexandrium_andersonii.AAC.1